MDGDKIGRTRMNLKQTAKGAWQADITVEYATPAEADTNMRDALDRMDKIVSDRGMVMAKE